MITTAHKEWEELQEIMTKEKPSQFAVVFDKDEQELQYWERFGFLWANSFRCCTVLESCCDCRARGNESS